MARSRLVAPLLLLSLLAVASANSSYDYSNDHSQNEKVIDHSNPTQPGSSEVYEHQSKQENAHFVFPSHEDVKPTESSYAEKSKSDNRDYQSHDGINYIVIQGNILCKSGISSYIGISGATAKLICPGSNVYGYEYAPFSIPLEANEHGYYCETYPVSKLPKIDWTQLVKECHVIPVSSPTLMCNFPNLISGGSDGAYVSYSRITGDKAYYNAGNVFFTPASSYDYPKQSTIPKQTSLPAGGGY